MQVSDVSLPNGFWNATTQTASVLKVNTANNGAVALFRVAEMERPDKTSPSGKRLAPVISIQSATNIAQYILQPCTKSTIHDSDHFLDLVKRRLIVGITMDKVKLQRFTDLKGAGMASKCLLVIGQDTNIALNLTASEKSMEPTAEALDKFNQFAKLFGKPGASSEPERKIAAEQAEQKVGKENVSTIA